MAASILAQSTIAVHLCVVNVFLELVLAGTDRSCSAFGTNVFKDHTNVMMPSLF